MFQKAGVIIGSLVLIAALLVLLVIMHYEQIEGFKDRLNTTLLEKAQLGEQYGKEKSTLADTYDKRLEEQRQKYQQEIQELKTDYESKIKSLKAEYDEKRLNEDGLYKEKLASLENENERLNKLLDDPNKRIPILVAEKNSLIKRVLDFYAEELERHRTICTNAKREYNLARNDSELFINVVRCREVTNLCQKEMETAKTLTDFYRKFVASNEPAFSELGLDKQVYYSRIDEAVLEFENTLTGMDKENNRLSEYHLKIKALQDWQDAGISVETGDIIYVLAGGNWSVRTKKYPDCTADGEPSLTPKYRRPEFEAVNTGALIARLKNNNIELPISQAGKQGKKFSFTSEMQGRLELVINDKDTRDNSGELDVRVLIKRMKD